MTAVLLSATLSVSAFAGSVNIVDQGRVVAFSKMFNKSCGEGFNGFFSKLTIGSALKAGDQLSTLPQLDTIDELFELLMADSESAKDLAFAADGTCSDIKALLVESNSRL